MDVVIHKLVINFPSLRFGIWYGTHCEGYWTTCGQTK